MAITGQTLADGQLPGSKTAIFTAASITYVRFLRLVNSDSSTRTTNIYVKRSGGTSRRILDKDKSLTAGVMYDVLGASLLVLSIGDVIEGDADSAAKVDYLIAGGT